MRRFTREYLEGRGLVCDMLDAGIFRVLTLMRRLGGQAVGLGWGLRG